MNKIRVGVLMGGLSEEREVSFNSGRTICDHLDTLAYEVIPLFQSLNRKLYKLPWHFLHRGKISDFEHRLASQATLLAWDQLKEQVDFMYLAMHGRYAEDGTIQGLLEILGIPYLGSGVYASALGMDKIKQKELLAAQGMAVPAGITATIYDIEHYAQREQYLLQQLHTCNVSFPLVVKPYHEGSSLGISIVHESSQLHAALLKAMTVHATKKQAVLIEEKVIGMEFSCIALMTEYDTSWISLPPTEVVADAAVEYFDYEQKYMPGRATEFTPARTSPENIDRIQKACIQASDILEIETISRIDGFLTADGRVVIVDANTLSGMGPSSFLFREAAHLNLSHTHVINHMIKSELHRYGYTVASVEHKESIAMETPKMKIGILMGGQSAEKEISLESGRNITYKLSPHKYEPIPLFVSSTNELYRLDQKLLVRNATKEIEHLVAPELKILWSDLPNLCDFVFIGLHGGLGENGATQGALEMLGLPYNGSSVLASALCMDKYKTTQFLKYKGFEVPRSILLSKEAWEQEKDVSMARILQEIPLPYIVKPHDDGCSILVQKVKRPEELDAAVRAIFDYGKTHALIEECIIGMELTVGVLGNETPRALPPSQAVATSEVLSITEKFLPGAGENQTPAPLPAHTLQLVQKIMEEVFHAVGCKGYARIDCFYQSATQSPTGQERVVILEINTLPGMTPATCIFHQAAEIGMRPMDFIDAIISLGIQEHGVQAGKAVCDAFVEKQEKSEITFI